MISWSYTWRSRADFSYVNVMCSNVEQVLQHTVSLTGHLSKIYLKKESFSSVQFSCSIMSDSLRPHGLQQARLPCPSPTAGACWNSRPLSRWYHLALSSSVIPLSACLQPFPESGSFPMSQFFPSSGQNIGVSASASVLPRLFNTDFL